MAKKSLLTIGQTYRKVKKEYLTVDGVYRNVKKVYETVNGIYVLRWTGGVTWKKYSCDVDYGYYEVASDIGFTRTAYYSGMDTSTFYSSFSFSSKSGYILNGLVTLPIPSAVGYYTGHNSQVFQIIGVTASTELGVRYEVEEKCVGSAWQSTSYSKGSTSYGEVTADEESLPEEGTLLRGGITEDYCVVRVGNTAYYYEKVMEEDPVVAILDEAIIGKTILS